VDLEPVPADFVGLERLEAFIGQSASIATVKRKADEIATRRSTIMILGETGAGKEMLARYIHSRSDRVEKPFIPVDCSSLSDTLFESELFGHTKGAFTGATRDSLGFIRAADTGTLFLDEIGELSLHLQAKLLRVLQERTVTPVGDFRARPVDVRLITATNRNLEQMVRAGQFRQDLFFRLNVMVLNLPPLRDRIDDIAPLGQHFLAIQAALYNEPVKRLSPAVIEVLRAYPWPGNVRELANVMEHAHVLAASGIVTLDDLPPTFIKGPEFKEATDEALNLIHVERCTIAKALKHTNYNKAAASRILGINIQKLNRMIARLNLHLPQ
jgi:transcriptional regulator with PAS, ATPase and Fis domain